MDTTVNKAIDTTYVSLYTHILGDRKLRTGWIPRLLGAIIKKIYIYKYICILKESFMISYVKYFKDTKYNIQLQV